MAGLEIKEWRIIGIDYYSGYEATFASLLVVPAGTVESFDGWAKLAAENDGAIPVTAFDLTTEAAEQLFRAFKRVSIHATPRIAIHEAGIELEIVERRGPDQSSRPVDPAEPPSWARDD